LRLSREQAVKKGCGEAPEKFAEAAKSPEAEQVVIIIVTAFSAM